MKGIPASVVVVCIASAIFCAAAPAAVYRCKTGGRLVYTSHPCGRNAVRLKLDDAAHSISMVTPKLPRKPAGAKNKHFHTPQRCPADQLSSIELRNLRVRHELVICESAAEVRASWGKPSTVKRTVSGDHVREHWVYKDRKGKPVRSVNLEDGKLVSFQK